MLDTDTAQNVSGGALDVQGTEELISEHVPVGAVLGLGPLDRAMDVLTFAILASEVVVVGLQVLTRYVLASPLPWTEELARVLVIWLMFGGGIVALRLGQHTRVTALVRVFSRDAQLGIALGANLVLVAFLAVLTYHAAALTLSSLGERLPASQLNGAIVNGAMPLALALMLAYLGRQLVAEVPAAVRSTRAVAAAGLTVAAMLASVLLPLAAEVTPVLALVFGFLVTAALGMPVAFALGLVSLTYLIGIGGVPLTILPIKIIGGVDSFVLLAIPLFIVGGALMETGGISQRIVALATALVGHVRGGLAYVVVVGEMLFSGISGSTTADVSAMSSLLIPAMKRAGYRGGEAVSIVASASAIGILVPPCITMIVLGSLANLSIATLFLAGFVPAAVMAGVLLGVIALRARVARWPTATRPSLAGLARATRRAIVPLGLPAIIFGGIFTGAVTVTEAALIAVVYALVVGVVLYREMPVAALPRLFVASGAVTAMTLWVLASASAFAWILAREQVPQLFAASFTALGGGRLLFMLMTLLIFVVIGALLEGLPALLIFGPILFPMAQVLGIDPIHYGIVIVAAMGVAFFLPPVGVGLYIACGIGKVDINEMFRAYAPYLLAMIAGLLIVAFVPAFTLVLPQLVQGYAAR